MLLKLEHQNILFEQQQKKILKEKQKTLEELQETLVFHSAMDSLTRQKINKAKLELNHTIKQIKST